MKIPLARPEAHHLTAPPPTPLKVDRKVAGRRQQQQYSAAPDEGGIGRERRLMLAELRKKAQAEQLRKALEEASAGGPSSRVEPQPWQELSAEYGGAGPADYAPPGASMGSGRMPPIDDEMRNRSPGLQNNFYETPISDFKRPYTGAKSF